MTDANKQLLPEEIKDTKGLQLHSLKAFMQALNYTWAEDNMFFDTGYYFEGFGFANRDRITISFETAVKLYNGVYNDNHGIPKFVSPFNFDVYSYKKAQAAKIVKAVKLQLNKKKKIIKVSNHLVEFADPLYYDMWINSKYFPF